MYSARRTAALPAVGFPIRISPDHSLVSGSPKLFAATHVLLRLLSPRHPSCTLSSLVSRVFLIPFLLLAKAKVQPGSSILGESLKAVTSRVLLLFFSLHLRLFTCQRALSLGGTSGLRPPMPPNPAETSAPISALRLLPMSWKHRVEPTGIEPVTSSLQSWRSTN